MCKYREKLCEWLIANKEVYPKCFLGLFICIMKCSSINDQMTFYLVYFLVYRHFKFYQDVYLNIKSANFLSNYFHKLL